MSFVTASVADRDTLAACRMSTASGESINSHTPSDAMTKNCGPSLVGSAAGVMSISTTSGSAMTPIAPTRWSPMDLPMASPGKVIFESSHTRAGPPHSYSGGETKPPRLVMRLYSRGVSGFWSSDMGTALSRPPSRTPNTARESPAFATHAVPFPPLVHRIRQTTAVVPDSSASMVGSFCSCASTARKTSLSAFFGLDMSSGCFSSFSCMLIIE
mmetsp:Transcript_27740/g.89656  ORF Transcript_27740/g.89656 Transcript_27740/m.89656 type:complete len:214 (-) Transcript_27740:453-1094(-)|eukprot:scaffold8629_cov114-Isochrysis_galbana.AAC.3